MESWQQNCHQIRWAWKVEVERPQYKICLKNCSVQHCVYVNIEFSLSIRKRFALIFAWPIEWMNTHAYTHKFCTCLLRKPYSVTLTSNVTYSRAVSLVKWTGSPFFFPQNTHTSLGIEHIKVKYVWSYRRILVDWESFIAKNEIFL